MNKAMALLLMMTSLFSQTATAQQQGASSLSKIKQKVSAPTSPYLADGFNIGFEFMDVNSSVADIKSKITGAVEKGFKNKTSEIPSQLGVRAGYKQIARGGLGFDLNLSVLKSEQRIENTSDLTTIMPAANFIVAAPDYFYGALGLNIAVVAGDENAEHTPRIGYQIGGGVILKKHLNLELFHTWTNQGIEYSQAWAEERTTSTNARLIYAF